MLRRIIYITSVAAVTALSVTGCKLPDVVKREENKNVPAAYANAAAADTTNTASLKWRQYFNDPHLVTLIDSALANNQELNITLQEIAVSKSEIQARKGEYLPFVGLRGGAGLDKVGRYTNIGALEHNVEIVEGKENPEPLQDYNLGLYANWELDIWKKLRNAKKAAVNRYLASVEGRNFMVTNIISEIADAYYELLALDNQLAIVNQNIAIQNNVLEIVKLQKSLPAQQNLLCEGFRRRCLTTRALSLESSSVSQKPRTGSIFL